LKNKNLTDEARDDIRNIFTEVTVDPVVQKVNTETKEACRQVIESIDNSVEYKLAGIKRDIIGHFDSFAFDGKLELLDQQIKEVNGKAIVIQSSLESNAEAIKSKGSDNYIGGGDNGISECIDLARGVRRLVILQLLLSIALAAGLLWHWLG
jgi:hypothetical protein